MNEIDAALLWAIEGKDHRMTPLPVKQPMLVALAKGANPNCIAMGKTALIRAISSHDSLSAITVLAEAGANLNLRGADGLAPLHACCVDQADKSTEAALLLSLGADAGQWTARISSDGDEGPTVTGSGTPLHFGAENRKPNIVALLCGRSEVDARDAEWNTPLMLAAKSGNARSVRALLGAGASVAAVNMEKETPLHFAMHLCDPEMASIILAAGGDIHARDHFGRTPFLAGAYTWTDSLKLLIDAGSDINAVGADGNTALHRGCKSTILRLVSELLERGAEPSVPNSDLETPLHFTARQSWCAGRPLAELLLSAGAEVSALDSKGRSPADLALELENKAMANFLLRAGSWSPMTAQRTLMRAIIRGDLPLARKALAGGADAAFEPDEDDVHDAPLTEAMRQGNPEMVALLRAAISEREQTEAPVDNQSGMARA